MELNIVEHSEFFRLKAARPAYKFKILEIFYPRSPFHQCFIQDSLIPTKVESAQLLQENLGW